MLYLAPVSIEVHEAIDVEGSGVVEQGGVDVDVEICEPAAGHTIQHSV